MTELLKNNEIARDFTFGNVKIFIDYGSTKTQKYMHMAFESSMKKFVPLNIKDYQIYKGRGWPTVTCHRGPEVFALSVYGEKEPI